jgi:hypothetical protein
MYYGIGTEICNKTQIYKFLGNYVNVMDDVIEGQMCGRRCEVYSYASRKIYVHDNKLNLGSSTKATEYFKVSAQSRECSIARVLNCERAWSRESSVMRALSHEGAHS